MFTGESVISNEVMKGKESVKNDTQDANAVRFFDPEKDRLDPTLRVCGENKGSEAVAKHTWEETFTTLDLEIPLSEPVAKGDLSVVVRSSLRPS